jgi:2-polyprenyl-3-methyl-5-hydroxy-6-metoxy-1,4-benzoquinol methylase
MRQLSSNLNMSASDTAYAERITPGTPQWKQDMVPHAQRYRFSSQFVRGKRVLDAGCGTGYGSRMIAEAGAREVVGVDISEEALAVARREFAHPVVQFVCDDCEALSHIHSGFDVVLSLESLEHFRRPEHFLGSVVARLLSSGIFVCSTPNGHSLGKVPENLHHIKEYSAAEFLDLLGRYFGKVELYGQQWTATFRSLSVLWSNPFMRLGRWLQRLRGRDVQCLYGLPPTEGDIIISDVNADAAWTLLALCRDPRRDASK